MKEEFQELEEVPVTNDRVRKRGQILKEFDNGEKRFYLLANKHKVTIETVRKLFGYWENYHITKRGDPTSVTVNSKTEAYFNSEDEYYDRIYYFEKDDTELTIEVDPNNLDINYQTVKKYATL